MLFPHIWGPNTITALEHTRTAGGTDALHHVSTLQYCTHALSPCTARRYILSPIKSISSICRLSVPFTGHLTSNNQSGFSQTIICAQGAARIWYLRALLPTFRFSQPCRGQRRASCDATTATAANIQSPASTLNATMETAADVLLRLQTTKLREKIRKQTRTHSLLVSIVVVFALSWFPLNVLNIFLDVYSVEVRTREIWRTVNKAARNARVMLRNRMLLFYPALVLMHGPFARSTGTQSLLCK